MSQSAEVAACTYCGLPMPPAWWPHQEALPSPAYCCYGCRFAAAVSGATGAEGQARWLLTRLGIAIFFAMNVMAFTMALWTQDVYPDEPTRFSTTLYGLFRHLCLLFTLPVLALLGGPLAADAWDGLKRGRLSTDLLLLAGVAAAVAVSAISVWRDDGPVYFEIACAVLVLVTLGRWLEARGKLQATEAVAALEKLLPDTVRLVEPGGERLVPRLSLAVGARVHVLAGERVPCDGIVVGQPATVDEQILTGESQAGVKEPGDRVPAGALNLDSDLHVEVVAGAADDTLARLVRLMRDARLAQGPYERLAERLAQVFLPAVILIALAAAGVHAWLFGLDRGILTGLAVVLIACPCALGIATPLAVWAALGRAAQNGVLFRSGEALERLARVRTVAFDKTGTLTTGTPRLAQWHCEAAQAPAELWQRTRFLACASTHALAQALAAAAPAPEEFPSALAKPGCLQTLPGRGMEAADPVSGAATWLGSLRLMRERRQTLAEPMQHFADAAFKAGRPLTAIAWEGRVRGLFVFEESLRPEATAALEALRRQKIQTHVLTGDHASRGERLAAELGVPVASALLPQDKVALLGRLRADGPVAMVGDGINDGPALAASDVGLALGGGADVVRAAAGVCLPGNDLRRVPWAIDLARRTARIIRQNLFWAVAYNILGIGLACTGRLNPVWAALAMTLSGGLVLVNSLRLTRGHEPETTIVDAAATEVGNAACLKQS